MVMVNEGTGQTRPDTDIEKQYLIAAEALLGLSDVVGMNTYRGRIIEAEIFQRDGDSVLIRNYTSARLVLRAMMNSEVWETAEEHGSGRSTSQTWRRATRFA